MTGNKATGSEGLGGAVFIWSDPNQTALVNCTLQNNEAPGSSGCGGGIHIGADDTSVVHIVSSHIEGNTAGEGGGGISTKIHGFMDTQVFLVNSVIAANLSGSRGGGIYNDHADMHIINSTFSDNEADGQGGALYTSGETVVVDNSILWANVAPVGPPNAGHEIFNDGSLVCISHSIIDGGKADIAGSTTACATGDCPSCSGSACISYCTTTNKEVDPKFIDGDYHIDPVDSPAIDAGDETAVPQDQFDVDENMSMTELTPDRDLNARKSGVEVDMGAYEVDCSDCPEDLDDSGVVGFSDLLSVLNAWGPCVGCPQDFDGNDDVGFSDLLTVVSAWGPCPCSGGAASPGDCADYDLGENCECRDTLLDLIENGTTNQSANARCWLDHYLTCHEGGCNGPAPGCSGDDPCGNH